MCTNFRFKNDVLIIVSDKIAASGSITSVQLLKVISQTKYCCQVYNT
jgi:hypothetical protein